MITTTLIIDDKKLKFISQYYEIATYIAIYSGNDMIHQFGINKSEYDYHNQIRKVAKKNGNEFVENESSMLVKPPKNNKK